VIRDELRALWAEPRAPDPPVRVWRDWLLLAACLIDTALEGVLRPDLTWRPLAVALAVGVSFVTLWRRTHPLATVAVTFGAAVALTLAGWLLGQPEPVGLYTFAVIPVLVYALTRWGSGRDIVLGVAVMLTAFAVSVVVDRVSLGDQVGGFVFLTLPGVVGAAVRFWTTSRQRELERMRSQERAEFARELHDTVAHHVSAIVVQAQAGRVLSGANPAAAVQALEGIEEEGARTLEAMRAMVGALRDADAGAELAPLSGVADLERLTRSPAGGPRVDLRLVGPVDDLPSAVDAAVYRIVQESVTNAIRHAVDATEVVVRVTAEPDRVRVTVRDDGAVTGPGHHRDGYGLAGLQERATLLGGVLDAGPCPERGWLVEAELPRGRVGGRGHQGSRR
jgi:signal transduction histidine kinase